MNRELKNLESALNNKEELSKTRSESRKAQQEAKANEGTKNEPKPQVNSSDTGILTGGGTKPNKTDNTNELDDTYHSVLNETKQEDIFEEDKDLFPDEEDQEHSASNNTADTIADQSHNSLNKTINPLDKTTEPIIVNNTPASSKKMDYDRLVKLADELEESDPDDLKNLTVQESIVLLGLKLRKLDETIKITEDSTDADKITKVTKLKRERNLLSVLLSQTGQARPGPSAPPAEGQKLKLFFKETPKFGGKSKEDFQKWLYEIKRSIKIMNLTEEEAFTAVGFKLESGPFEQHRHYTERSEKDNKVPRFNEFVKTLEDRYGNNLRKQQAREKLLSL